MHVDGTNNVVPGGNAPPPKPSSRSRSGDSLPGISQENRLSAVASGGSDGARRTLSLRDSFQHSVPNSAAPATYSSEGFRANRPTEDEPPASDGASPRYTAEIADLETAVNARGLPLLPDSESTGVFSQAVFKAYEKAADESTSPPDNPSSDIVDTIG